MNSFILEILSYSAVKTIKHIYREKKKHNRFVKKNPQLKNPTKPNENKEKNTHKERKNLAQLISQRIEGCSKIPYWYSSF